MFESQRQIIGDVNTLCVEGRLREVTGLSMLADGLACEIGTMCRVHPRGADPLYAQVVGFQQGSAVLMPLSDPRGAAAGDAVADVTRMQRVGVGAGLLGRVVDALGRPLDTGGPIHPEGYYPVYAPPPKALSRTHIDAPLGTGIRVVDAMLSVGCGQRLGIFAGTGVGKSVLLGMIARQTAADVSVVALVGERGREVVDFMERDLGPEGMARTVMVVSTSDESPVMRVRACFLATAIAEYFRDQGRHVLLLMDSLTRLAMAQREIGLAAGEPPATKGYTPSVFGLLPRLLERSGRIPGGSITGFYSVLVEGDDRQDPIADAVRGILDGHMWLSRDLASRGHYPAVDVGDSISRLMPDVVSPQHLMAARTVRRTMAAWTEVEDLVNLGAYARGSNSEADVAIDFKPAIDRFFQQMMNESVSFEDASGGLIRLAGDIQQATTT